MIQFWLFVSMLAIGIIYAALFHLIAMPLFNNILLHCIILGVVFGVTSYLVALSFYRKYYKLKDINQYLNLSLITDKLTGLYNRRAFDYDVLNFRTMEIYSVIFIDIDNFKAFNDRFGHQVGDVVLARVGQCIKSIVRNEDKVYRYGGEEIVVLLEGCNKMNANKVAEKIRHQVSCQENNPYPKITVSLGVSSYPDDGDDIQSIIVQSDKALLQAKKSGRNCAISYG